MSQPPYTLNDLLLLIGQQTVELAYARGRVAELETRLAPEKDDHTVLISDALAHAQDGSAACR